MSYEFTYIHNGSELICTIGEDFYWRHNKQTGKDYEEPYSVIESVIFKGVDVSEIIGEGLEDDILKAYKSEFSNA
jgi:hypothetical protein